MLFTTQLELNITIKDINAIYTTEYDQMLLDHAKLLYERKCMNGQYVKSIDRLMKRSLANLIKRDLTSKVRVYVVVEATVIRYDQYDFITGTRVNKIIPAGKISNFNMLECRNDHVVALMKVQKGIERFEVGDIIPIRVGQTMYKIGNEHILVNGFPCLPYVPDPVLMSMGRMTPETEEYFKTMLLPLFERELGRKQTLDQERWKQFSELLHPYRTAASPGNASCGVMDVSTIENGLFGVDHRVSLTEMRLTKADPKATDGAPVVSEPPQIALTRLAVQFIKWLEVINALTEQYATDSAFHQLDHVWDAFKEAREK
jgi:hypothetical protein